MAQIRQDFPTSISNATSVQKCAAGRLCTISIRSPLSPTVDATDLAMPELCRTIVREPPRSQAVRRGRACEYEATAKEIESMGVELVERVKQCETHDPRRSGSDRGFEGDRRALSRGGQTPLCASRAKRQLAKCRVQVLARLDGP